MLPLDNIPATADAALFRSLFDLMPQLGWTALPDGFIDFYNRGWYEYTGTTFEQMQGWGWQSVHDPEMLPKVVERWRHSIETGTPFEMEFPLRRHDGSFRWFLTRVNPLRDGDGNIVRWVGINTDVDDRRQHTRTLERLSEIGRTISADLDVHSVLQAVTDAATELSGAQFGAFFYNVVNDAGESYMLFAISGVPREHFSKFPMPRNTAIFAPTFAGEKTVVLDDVRKDPRFGRSAPYHGLPPGHLPVVSYLAVPVVSRGGEVLGGLFFGHPQPGVFTQQSAQVVEGLAAQAAVTLDNARLYQRILADRSLIRQSEERYRSLVEASPTPQAVGSSDPEGYVVEDSPSWRALTGQSFHEMRGRGWIDAVHPDFREATIAELEGAIAERRIYQMEFRLRLKDGTYRWFASKGVPVYDENGGLREWIGTTTDVDQRRSTEEHLRFLARANELFASSLDYQTTLTNLTQAAVPALADWCAVDMAGKGDWPYERLAVAHVDPAKIELAWEIYRKFPPDAAVDPIAAAIRSGKSQLVRDIPDELLRSVTSSDEHYRIAKDLGLVSWMVVPLPGRRGSLGAITFVSSDSKRLFTELDLVHAEEFARQASVAIENAMLYRDAQEANRAKDDFLATLSHELRTPMTAILGWSRMLQEGGLDEATYSSAIESILRSAHAQALLIDDVLDMSRIIAGKMQMDPQAVDVIDVVQAAMRTIQPAADAKGVALELQQRPGASLVTGDPNRLQQIIWNLLSNAIKFTPREGQVIARVEQSGSFVRVRIRDTGKGIAPSFLPHVFEPFRQAENVTTRTQGGLGLGLAIVKELVGLHGGNISAHSDGEGKGATFTVELPVRAVHGVEATHRASLERYTAERGRDQVAGALYPSLEGVRVLFVDDQDDARMLVKTVLVRCGAHVSTAASVADAITHLDGDETDIVVTDIAMPDADGFSLIDYVRNIRKLTLPVIAMTAFGHPSDQEKILTAGFSGYLKKPVEPIDLARELHSIVQRTSRR
ncbi:MAG: PAS domain S-box protein [Acidobacteriota bacterium]|nr:PAS domain S-box protein [Acidobacteriota bacterium]